MASDTSQEEASWKRSILMYIYTPLMILPIILIFIYYNYLGSNALVFCGWMILVVGVVLVFAAGHEFQQKGGVPEGKHLIHTTRVVNTGVYAVVRHPQYLGFILVVLGLVLVSQHWLSFISGGVGSILFYIDVLKEDQVNIEKFGEAYSHYKKRVPAMNFVIGLIRLRHRKE